MLREIKTKTQRLFQHNLLYIRQKPDTSFPIVPLKLEFSVSVIIMVLETKTVPACLFSKASIYDSVTKSSFGYLEAYRWKLACITRTCVCMKAAERNRVGYIKSS